jgi:hypothetical protein
MLSYKCQMSVFTLKQMIEIANTYMRENDIRHTANFKQYHTRCASIDFPLVNAETVAEATSLIINQRSDYNQNYMENENNIIYIQISPFNKTTPIIFNTEDELKAALRHLIPKKRMTPESSSTMRMTPESSSTMERLISIEEKLDKLLARDK